MYHIIEQTDEEKMTMYMKFLKKKLVSMLIEANRVISLFTPIVAPIKGKLTADEDCVICGKQR